MKRTCRTIAFLSLLLTACSVGPDYKKPVAALPVLFKEAAGWKVAEPKDLASRGEWWQMFCDSELNVLVAQLNINNENIKAAEARFRQAQAIVSQARSSYFPNATVDAGVSRERVSSARPVGNSYSASLGTSWEVDIWGKIRRTVEANTASAAASESDLAAARLSAQAELATNYLSLRVADEQKRLLNETVDAYRKSLELTENLYKDGLQNRSDYLQAKVQLESARAQAINVDVQRSAYEHAIAVLIGKAPAEFTLAPVNSVPYTPTPPVTLPSTVLERRPDVAAAERRAAAANARIGVAEAAFFPDFTLSASAGYTASSLAEWFTAPSRVWTIGPSMVFSVFDAGLRSAQTAEAIAAYDEQVALYRQTVLGAFQEVEDNLSALRALNEEQSIRNTAVEDAKASVELINNQYKEGITSYLNVATAQTTELNNALSALSVKRQRMVAAVTLIKALGGRWETPHNAEVTPEDFALAAQTIPAPVTPVAVQAVPEAVKLEAPKKP